MNEMSKEKQSQKNDVDAQNNETTSERDKIVDDQQVCQKAPEWAEHQRLWEDDVPCDDGRSGKL